jgi:hypothetical protein
MVWKWLARSLSAATVSIVAVGWPPVSVWATPPPPTTTAGASPLAGTGPSSTGMPGAALVQQLLSWGQWVGMAACAMVIIYGAATWHGFAGASAGRSVAGKTFVMAGAVGLLVIGLLPTMVTMLFDAGRS